MANQIANNYFSGFGAKPVPASFEPLGIPAASAGLSREEFRTKLLTEADPEFHNDYTDLYARRGAELIKGVRDLYKVQGKVLADIHHTKSAGKVYQEMKDKVRHIKRMGDRGHYLDSTMGDADAALLAHSKRSRSPKNLWGEHERPTPVTEADWAIYRGHAGLAPGPRSTPRYQGMHEDDIDIILGRGRKRRHARR